VVPGSEPVKGSAKKPEKPASGGTDAGSVSPMEFWRRGSARSARPAGTQKKLGFWQRITGMHFPAWVPVVGIILVVFGILGGLFFFRSAAAAPKISDHWHARYDFTVCGQRQPNALTWEGVGVHTHGDGIIHIHPFQTSEEGQGARLIKWFEYGGGKLSNDTIKLPSLPDEYKNGDTCPDGSEGVVQIFVTSAETGVEERLENVNRYIPKDGDRVRMVFGPEESEPVVAEDRTIIAEDRATKDIEVVVTDDGGGSANAEATTRFEPNRLAADAGDVVKLTVRNTGSISHGFRMRGVDATYDTSDDFVVTPDGQDPATSSGILQPGGQGFVIVEIGTAGEIEFRDDTIQSVTGVFVVGQAPEVTASPTPAAEAVDAEVSVVMKDNFYEPPEFSVPAGKRFRINLTNEGPSFAHNLRIAGPDSEFDTDDDLVSEPSAQRVGVSGELVGQIDEAGTYPVRCDFHAEQTGTLTVTPQ
jgi:plastocyanin